MSTILTIRTGGNDTTPLPLSVMETFESAEITQTDDGPSAFQLTFRVGRTKSSGMDDYKQLIDSHFKIFNRVTIYVKIDGVRHVLMHGMITHHQLNPSNQPGLTTMTITGEDMSVMMEMEERKEQYANQDAPTIVRTILDRYRQFKVDGKVVLKNGTKAPLKIDHVPTQIETDRQYVGFLAKQMGLDFFMIPDLDRSTAYWGDPVREGDPQPAISVNLKQGSNSDSLNFSYNGLSATKVKDQFQTRVDDKTEKVDIQDSSVKTLSKEPAIGTIEHVRKVILPTTPGLDLAQAIERAQGMVNKSVEDALTVSGQVNGFRYRSALKARYLVGLRGAGKTFNGTYYVKSVTHKLRRGEYTQSFVLTREGVKSKESEVKPS